MQNILPTWVSDDGEFAIRLLDLQLGRIRFDPKGIVVGGIDDHDCGGGEMSKSEARLRLAAVKFHVVFREMTFAVNNGKAEAGGDEKLRPSEDCAAVARLM